MYLDWIGVGWRRRCKTRLSLRDLASQGTVFFLAVTTAGGRVKPFINSAGRTTTPHKGDDRITHCACDEHPGGSYSRVNPLLSREVAAPVNIYVN